ncbi:MAG: patatin-like phospholipase family protein, partial [Actinomycetota bacterium]|nr:patatin-like phospholipase family protein [Actinomycetota bacterium]
MPRTVDDPLKSRTLGTSSDDLVRPCEKPRPDRAPAPDVPRQPPIAVALSGGGFRATLSGLGVLRFVADAGMLGQVRHVSSVSGGSVANGMFASRYPAVRDQGFTAEAFDTQVLRPLVERVSSLSLQRRMMAQVWKILGRKTRTDLLADEFDRWFFGGMLLEELAGGCRFAINAANTSTGVRFMFERDLVGDYVIGRIPTAGTGVRLARAVAASAAVPGLLPPMVLEGLQFPCQRGRTVRLVDGGAYDNMGLEAVDDLADHLLVSLNAGGLFVTGRYGGIPLIRDLQLAQSLLYRQSTALRRRMMVDRFQAWEAARDRNQPPPPWSRRGVLFGLATTLEPRDNWRHVNPAPPMPDDVAFVKTSFDRFPRELCEKLV